MLTDRQRLDNLEADLVALKAELRIAGALTINVMVNALDQMVDEKLLPSATRTEILGRIRSDLRTMRVGSADVVKGADAAMPFYRTKVEADALKHQESQFRANEEELRRVRLSLRTRPDPPPKPEEPE